MGFKRGTSGNPNGRPKGAKGKAKGDLVARVAEIMESNIDRLQNDLEALEPIERIKAITQLIGYVIPKKQALNVQQSIDYEYKKLEELLKIAPDEAIDQILDRINNIREINGESRFENDGEE